jgi:hypothetical protein
MPRAILCQPQLFILDVTLASTCNAAAVWSPAASNMAVPRRQNRTQREPVQQWAIGLIVGTLLLFCGGHCAGDVIGFTVRDICLREIRDPTPNKVFLLVNFMY